MSLVIRRQNDVLDGIEEEIEIALPIFKATNKPRDEEKHFDGDDKPE